MTAVDARWAEQGDAIPVVDGHQPVVLRASAISKRVGGGRASRQILQRLDLTVARGEMDAILGRSGSGKSTLLHLLGGLDRPDSGHIHVAGQSLTEASERTLSRIRLRRLGFIFQSFQLIEELSGAENVMLAAGLPGAAAHARARAASLIERLGIAGIADRLPHELSGGEQQRFAIARALVNDPLLVLADEETGSLDASSGATVRVVVLDLVRRDGGSGGLVHAGQPRWLARQLSDAAGRWVLVFSHQPLTSTAGAGPLLALLDGHPRMLAAISGHTHRHRIAPRAGGGGGYWLISTASLIDYPQQRARYACSRPPAGALRCRRGRSTTCQVACAASAISPASSPTSTRRAGALKDSPADGWIAP